MLTNTCHKSKQTSQINIELGSRWLYVMLGKLSGRVGTSFFKSLNLPDMPWWM